MMQCLAKDIQFVPIIIIIDIRKGINDIELPGQDKV